MSTQFTLRLNKSFPKFTSHCQYNLAPYSWIIKSLILNMLTLHSILPLFKEIPTFFWAFFFSKRSNTFKSKMQKTICYRCECFQSRCFDCHNTKQITWLIFGKNRKYVSLLSQIWPKSSEFHYPCQAFLHVGWSFCHYQSLLQ